MLLRRIIAYLSIIALVLLSILLFNNVCTYTVHAEERTYTQGYYDFTFEGHFQRYYFVSSFTGPPYFMWCLLVSDEPFTAYDHRYSQTVNSYKSDTGIYFLTLASSPAGGISTDPSYGKIIDVSDKLSYSQIQSNSSIFLDGIYLDTSFDNYTSDDLKENIDKVFYTTDKDEYITYMKEAHPELYPEPGPVEPTEPGNLSETQENFYGFTVFILSAIFGCLISMGLFLMLK